MTEGQKAQLRKVTQKIAKDLASEHFVVLNTLGNLIFVRGDDTDFEEIEYHLSHAWTNVTAEVIRMGATAQIKIRLA